MVTETAQLNIPLEGVNRYNPQNIPKLEEFVNQQCQTESYNLNANLALLKLYQFNPQTINVEVICKVLLKALIRFPDSDLVLCLALLNEQVVEDESVKKILALSDAMETANITKIWPSLEACSALTSSIKGFTDAIRKCEIFYFYFYFYFFQSESFLKFLPCPKRHLHHCFHHLSNDLCCPVAGLLQLGW